MANVNQVLLVGRLTRDVETRSLNSGETLANIGFCVNNRKKQGDEWVDDPVFVDVTAWGRTAENAAKYLSKGSQAYISGRLVLDQWNDKNTGEKRSKLKIVAEDIQYLDPAKKRDEHDQSGGHAGGGDYGYSNQGAAPSEVPY